jgi:transposase-like protein
VAARKYTPDLKAQALRLVDEAKSAGQRRGVIPRIADQLGINRDTLRNWVSCAAPTGAGSVTVTISGISGKVWSERDLYDAVQRQTLIRRRWNPGL